MPEVNATTAMALLPLEEDKPASLKKRRSCELVETPSPCVKKALFHLARLKKLLKLALEDPIVDIEQVSDQNVQYHDKHPRGWKHLWFEISHHPQSGSTVSKEERQMSEDGDLLTITGIGGQIRDIVERGDAERTVHVSRLKKKNQLSPHEVFTQVRELILRLEEDRLRTEKRLEIENRRVANLDQRIDRICQKKLIQLPIAVQREHDAYSTDISELQWHVENMKRQLIRSSERVEAAENLNRQLEEKNAAVTEHCPLLEGKLLLEIKSLEDIRSLQKQTDTELIDAKIELQKIEQRYQEAAEKAERERKEMEKKIEAMRGQLKLLKRDLHHSEAMHTTYIKKGDKRYDKMADQEAELLRLQTRAEEAKEEEQEELYKIEQQREHLRQVEFETAEIKKQKAATDAETVQMEKEMKDKINALVGKYESDLAALRNLQQQNRDIQLDIDDMAEQVKSCEKIVVKCDKDYERYIKDRERVDPQLKEATAEFQTVNAINIKLTAQLEKEKNKALAIEGAMEIQSDILRKRILEEVKQRNVLEGKIRTNRNLLLKAKAENKKKRSKITRTLKKTEESLAKIHQNYVRLKDEHKAAAKVVKDLETKHEATKAKHESQERHLAAERDILIPEEKVLLTLQISLKEKIKELDFDEKQFQEKLRNILLAKSAMGKRLRVIQENMDVLLENLKEVTLRYETGRKTRDDLKRLLDEAARRLLGWKWEHEKTLETRGKVNEKMVQNVDDELDRNRELAQQYRDLQSKHIDVKNRLMSLYDNKVKLEGNVKDHKQLLALQEKFNVAITRYHFDRRAFHKASLEKFQNQAQDNSHAMGKVRAGLQKTLTHISKFLRDQIEGVAANKVVETGKSVPASDGKLSSVSSSH